MSKSIAYVFFSLLSKAFGIVCGFVVVLYFVNQTFKTNYGIWLGPRGSMSFFSVPESRQDLLLAVFILGGAALVCYLIKKAFEYGDWLKANRARASAVVLGSVVGLILISSAIISYGNSLSAKNTGGKLLEGIGNNVDEATLIRLIEEEKENQGAPQTTMSYYAFQSAVRGNNLQAIRILVKNGFNINAQAKELYRGSGSGETALMEAAGYGTPEMVGELLTNGAEANLQDSLERTALHYSLSSISGQAGVDKVRRLLAAGANPDITNYEKKTARDIVKSDYEFYPGAPDYYRELADLFALYPQK